MAIQTINNGESGSIVRSKLNSNFSELATTSGAPGGTDTQVQFNDGGVFGGASGWTWNKATNTNELNLGTSGSNFKMLFDGTGTRTTMRVFEFGVEVMRINGAGISLGNITAIGWSTGAAGAYELTLQRDAANTLAQRNGTNAQTSRIYGSFTDAGNYERGSISSNASGLVIGHEAAGTGTARPLLFQTGGATRFTIDVNGRTTFTNQLDLGNFRITPTGNAFFVAEAVSAGDDSNGGFGLRVYGLGYIGWASGTGAVGTNTPAETAFWRDGAFQIAQRSGTNANTFRVYGTFAGAGNHRRLSLGMSTAGVAEIKPEGAGTGASGNVLHISGLPTSNPGPGILWNDAGTVKVGT